MPSSAYPVPYVPGSLPKLNDNLNIFITNELKKIQVSITGILNILPQVATAAPAKPMEGMMRLATAPWEPIAGTTSPTWVIYDATAGWTLV